MRFPFKNCGEETEDVHRGSEIPLLYDVVMGILRYLFSNDDILTKAQLLGSPQVHKKAPKGGAGASDVAEKKYSNAKNYETSRLRCLRGVHHHSQ